MSFAPLDSIQNSHCSQHWSLIAFQHFQRFFLGAHHICLQSQSGQRGEPSTAGCHSCRVEVSSWTGSRWVQQKIFGGVSGRVVLWMFSPEQFKSGSLVHDLGCIVFRYLYNVCVLVMIHNQIILQLTRKKLTIY